MTASRDRWVLETLDLLACFQFTDTGLRAFRQAPIRLVTSSELRNCRGPSIFIPTDIDAPLRPAAPWHVYFGSTELCLWNPIAQPDANWAAIPDTTAPMWWRHVSGALTPAWNLWANVTDLLTSREEREINVRDEHGRFPSCESPRAAVDIAHVPAVNDANAALLAAARSLVEQSGPADFDPSRFVAAPALALSHDCDQLRGNDLMTQSIRVFRAGKQLAKGNVGEARRSAWAVIANAVQPSTYFAGNLRGMIALERQYGFRSISYFLTGRGGRFGARSSASSAALAASSLPRGFEAGVHYNYWSMGESSSLEAEQKLIRDAAGKAVTAGRAHYLRFNALDDFPFLEKSGIRLDESVGWADRVSYRAGVAGPFRPFDETTGEARSIIELPLSGMDHAMWHEDNKHTISNLLRHLSGVGGVLSILVHPGAFHNPEYPQFYGRYASLLKEAYGLGCRTLTPSDIIQKIDGWLGARRIASA